jgi:predicted choloylglycine hydrolase
MGYQHGSLLKEQVQQNYRAIQNFAYMKGITYDELLEIWNIMKDYVSENYLNEMQGLADGAGLSFEEINTINMVPTKLGTKLFQCSGISAWGPATENGMLIHARSYDYPLWMKDPISGRYIQENQAIMIRKPDNGYASFAPTIIGLFGGGGFNENGLGIGLLYSWSDDQTIQGNPIRFRILNVLDKASSVQEAIDILCLNKTLGYNSIISDAKNKIGYAIEMTKNFTYVGTWNNDVEANHPFWKIDHVVRRTNVFINKSTAATQRTIFDSSRLLLFLIGRSDYYPMYVHYRALSRAIESRWGNLNINNSINVFRDAYSGNNDLIIFLTHKILPIKILSRYYGYLESVNQWVSTPENGDIKISFASAHKNAWENEIHSFNFYDLLGQN